MYEVPDRYDLEPCHWDWSPLDSGGVAIRVGTGLQPEWLVPDDSAWRTVPGDDPVVRAALGTPDHAVGPATRTETPSGRPTANRWMRSHLPDGAGIRVTQQGPVRGGMEGVASVRLALVGGRDSASRAEWSRDVDGVVVAHTPDGRAPLTADGQWYGLVLSDETTKWFRLTVGDALTGEIRWTTPRVDAYAYPLTYAIDSTGEAAVVHRTPVGLRFFSRGELVRTLFVCDMAFPPQGDCIYVTATESPPLGYLLACMTYAGDVIWVSQGREDGTIAVSPDGQFVGVLAEGTCRLYEGATRSGRGGQTDPAGVTDGAGGKGGEAE